MNEAKPLRPRGVKNVSTATAEAVETKPAAKETKPKKPRYKGPIEFKGVADEEAVASPSTDLSKHLPIVQKAHDNKTSGKPSPAVGVTVPAESKGFHETMFRKAADSLGVGLSIAVVKPGDSRDKYSLHPSEVRLVIETRKRRTRKTAAKTEDAPVSKVPEGPKAPAQVAVPKGRNPLHTS